jgi:hypothetical protein
VSGPAVSQVDPRARAGLIDIRGSAARDFAVDLAAALAARTMGA